MSRTHLEEKSEQELAAAWKDFAGRLEIARDKGTPEFEKWFSSEESRGALDLWTELTKRDAAARQKNYHRFRESLDKGDIFGMVKAWATIHRPDLPVENVFDALVKDYRGPGTRYRHFEVTRLSGGRAVDVISTLVLLAGPPACLLSFAWCYTDLDGNEFVLSDDQIAQIFGGGCFFHPLSGQEIYDARRLVEVVYRPIVLALMITRERQKDQGPDRVTS